MSAQSRTSFMIYQPSYNPLKQIFRFQIQWWLGAITPSRNLGHSPWRLKRGLNFLLFWKLVSFANLLAELFCPYRYLARISAPFAHTRRGQRWLPTLPLCRGSFLDYWVGDICTHRQGQGAMCIWVSAQISHKHVPCGRKDFTTTISINSTSWLPPSVWATLHTVHSSFQDAVFGGLSGQIWTIVEGTKSEIVTALRKSHKLSKPLGGDPRMSKCQPCWQRNVCLGRVFFLVYFSSLKKYEIV